MRGADPWKSSDPLGEALHFLRMTGSFYVRSEMSGSWGLALPAMDDAVWFHTVVDGSCVLSVPGESTRELLPGDFALVPHGRGHVLAADIESVADATSVYEVPHDYVSDRYAVSPSGIRADPPPCWSAGPSGWIILRRSSFFACYRR